MTQQDEEALTRCYLFSPLNEQERKDAFHEMHISVGIFPAGAVVCSPEHFFPAMIYVISGTLTIERTRQKKSVFLKEIGAGESFGAAGLFGDCESYPTTVRAKTDVRFAAMDEESLKRLFLSYPKTAVAHIEFLSERVRFLNEKLDATTGRNVESKVSKCLLDMNGKDALHRRLNMTKMAESLDIGRASLYRLLTRFQAEGLISLSGGRVTVLDSEGLKKKADASPTPPHETDT